MFITQRHRCDTVFLQKLIIGKKNFCFFSSYFCLCIPPHIYIHTLLDSSQLFMGTLHIIIIRPRKFLATPMVIRNFLI